MSRSHVTLAATLALIAGVTSAGAALWTGVAISALALAVTRKA